MNIDLLEKVGFFVNGVVGGGYILAGLYAVGIVVRYVQDYREAVNRDEVK